MRALPRQTAVLRIPGIGCCENPSASTSSVSDRKPAELGSMGRPHLLPALAATIAFRLAGCGASASGGGAANASSAPARTGTVLRSHPQAIEPTVGEQPAVSASAADPIGDPNAHAVSLAEVK